jgi:hypothetical protein
MTGAGRGRMNLQRIADWFLFAFDTDMSRHDRQAWASAKGLVHLGSLTEAWLRGELRQTPSHGGPPDPETIPHIEVLAAANRAGFITTNSQSATTPAEIAAYGWREGEAYVDGLVSDNALQRLQAAVIGTPLVLSCARGRQAHGPAEHRWLRRAWRSDTDFYTRRCPGAADEIASAWWVHVSDPETGTNARLWPMLAAFAGLTSTCPSCSYCQGGSA